MQQIILSKNFNPPSPCGEGPESPVFFPSSTKFQSTLPMRGGTHPSIAGHPCIAISIHPPHAGRDPTPASHCYCNSYFNPPSPCGEGLRPQAPAAAKISNFNPPSPCGEGLVDSNSFPSMLTFQSTLPLRGGTIDPYFFPRLCDISIHPPHAGRDAGSQRRVARGQNFNPPSPCGEGR